MIKFGDPQVGQEEIDYMRYVFDSKIFVHGSMTAEFEQSFGSLFGYEYALSVANCTAGLHLAHYSLTKNREPRSQKCEVICTAMTHVATAHAIELAGLTPVFVDCNSHDANVDIQLLENAITENTVGIAAMHFNGIPCEIEKIAKIASDNKFYIVEDCAIALGAKVGERSVGTFGDVGAFSFHPVKQMTTGEGGMIVVNNSTLYEELKLERAFGVDRTFDKRKQAGVYDAPLLGFNYRMAEIPAAMGVKQLEKFEKLESLRKDNFIYLKEMLSTIPSINTIGDEIIDGRAYYCLIAKVDGGKEKRDKVAEYLKDNDIQTSVYYPHPVPRLSYYAKKYGYSSDKFKNATMIADETIAFSIGPHLNEESLHQVTKALKEVI